MEFEAFTLEEAITKASVELGCSVTELDFKVLQHPKSGILGFFKKNAIIDAKKVGNTKSLKKTDISSESKKAKKEQNIDKGEKSQKSKKDDKSPQKPEKQKNNFENKKEFIKPNNEKVEINKAIIEIKNGIENLFKNDFFNINSFEVNKFDDKTIYIKLDGDDAALLIGKEGYRYKAITHLLHNWIYPKYGYHVRLEISRFLENQEKMIAAYLVDVIEKVKTTGKAQTKPLDGVLVRIALEQLRNEFPNNYVGVRSSRHGKFIVIRPAKNE